MSRERSGFPIIAAISSADSASRSLSSELIRDLPSKVYGRERCAMSSGPPKSAGLIDCELSLELLVACKAPKLRVGELVGLSEVLWQGDA